MVPNDVESDLLMNIEKLYSLAANFIKHWVIVRSSRFTRNNHSLEEKRSMLMVSAFASYYS